MSGPEPDAVAAAILASLPSMTPPRLRRLLGTWREPTATLEAVARGDGGVALRGDSARDGGVARGWSDALAAGLATRVRSQLRTRGTHVRWLGAPDWPLDPDVTSLPAVLLAEGARLDALTAPRVAIVGTRAATPHGLADARELASALAAAGVTVVSGLAIGIDAAAHEGALASGGLTIGVVATGLDVVYPRRHATLFERVRGAGLVLGEHPYGVTPTPERFPVRNRIIAGLADVVVVVEATLQGGARITAERALDLGRTVLAQPGSRRNAAAAGTNALIADGATPLLSPDDVLLALGMTPGARRAEVHLGPEPDGDPGLVLEALGGEPASLDELAARTQLAAGPLSRAVATLERSGRATRHRGLVWPA